MIDNNDYDEMDNDDDDQILIESLIKAEMIDNNDYDEMDNDDFNEILVKNLIKAEKEEVKDPLLFAREDGLPMTFYMVDYDQGVKDKVEEYGGVVVDQDTEIFRNSSIVLCNNSLTNMMSNKERFDKKFINECVNQNRIVDLAEYKINHTSNFSKYDPTEILFGEKTWDQVGILKEVDEEINRIVDLSCEEIFNEGDVTLAPTIPNLDDYIPEDDFESQSVYFDVGRFVSSPEMLTEDEALALGVRFEKSI